MQCSKATWSSRKRFAQELHVVYDFISNWSVPSLLQSQEPTAICGLFAAADGEVLESKPMGANQA